VVLPLVALASTALLVQWVRTAQPPDLLIPALIAQGLLALKFRHAVHHVSHSVAQREQELRVLATLLERIEREPFDSPLLTSIVGRLRTTGHHPAAEVHRLARLVEMLSSGHNQIFAPVSALLLLGTQLAFAVEAWRVRCGPAVRVWLMAVAEIEALSALGTYAAEHPEDPFPVIRDEGPACITGDALAHPLLPMTVAVANDVRLGEDEPHLLLVSGSNMSGKSTLLRTVGLNTVLALAGAPVRARQLTLTPVQIGATLRIQDSLQAGRSRFFAEISRISEIVTLTSGSARDRRVLFLLDELLSGTNSHDRLQGATGILRGLVDRGAIGLATTHDLALTAIASDLGLRAANVHFEDRFENGVLSFDYRLKPGVVRSSNAIALMRAVGLDV
jgi:DNA mismatch repair ATPase MutS